TADHRSGAAIAAMPAADGVDPRGQRTPAPWMGAGRALLRRTPGARAGPRGPPTAAAGRGRGPTERARAIAACPDDPARPSAPNAPRLPAPCARPAPTGPPSGPASALQENRRRPTLPGPREPSTIGAEGLNFSVRNGKRCFPLAKATEKRARPASPVLQNCTA